MRAVRSGLMATALPTEKTRWRCRACGNLTRFDVVRTTRTREFIHADLAGEQEGEGREVLADVVEQVTCRGCNGLDALQLGDRPNAWPARPPRDPTAGK